MKLTLTDEELEQVRRSGIRLDAEGRFWHEGAEVTHHGLRAALWRWLNRNPDGRYVLRLDDHRFVYLDVDDAPYVVRSLRWQGDAAVGQLSDGAEESLELDTLRLDAQGRAYVSVKGGRFDARVSSAAWSTLAERMVDESGAAWLVTGATRRRLGQLEPER